MRIKFVEKSPASIKEEIDHYKHFEDIRKYKESIEAVSASPITASPTNTATKVAADAESINWNG